VIAGAGDVVKRSRFRLAPAPGRRDDGRSKEDRMIECTEVIDVERTPGQIFDFIDAEEKAPHWLGRCAQLVRTSAGEKGVGSTLRYVYKQGGRTGTMDGVVTAYEPGRRLGMKVSDRMFAVSLGIELTATARGSRVTEHVEIEPRNLAGRLLSPILRLATRRQAAKDLSALKHWLERPG
jgi:uncharacterized protein YndB with AHSA1/START domain